MLPFVQKSMHIQALTISNIILITDHSYTCAWKYSQGKAIITRNGSSKIRSYADYFQIVA